MPDSSEADGRTIGLSASSSTRVVTEFDVPCVLRDGTVLRANVYRPADGGDVPVLLLRHPYSKDNPFAMAYLDIYQTVRAGYIVVVQDVRGRFASDGDFAPSIQEQDDGVDAVGWAARLPGSNGVVGTWGASYGAETQWSAALGRPAALTSMVTFVPPSHSHVLGFQMRGGAYELGSRMGWSHGVGLEELRRHADPGPDGWRAALDSFAAMRDLFDSGEIFRIRPLSALPDLEPFVSWAAESFGIASTDPSRRINITDGHYDEIDVPVFMAGGWYDVFLGSTFAQYRGTLEHAKAAGLRRPHLIIGPWTHGVGDDRIGELSFGVFASGQTPGGDVSLTEQHIRWFDATLKGRTESLDGVPAVRIFVMGDNRWVSMDEFPPRADLRQRWYLGDDGALLQHAPDAESVATYRYDPADPVPTLGGGTLLPAPHVAGPLDQRPIEVREDVLTYTSRPLDEHVTVIGPVDATIFARSSAVDTDFVVRVCDVYEDGRSICVADGIVRASARQNDGSLGDNGLAPSPIEPGAVYEFHIDLWVSAITFIPGHSIRVDITSSSFPRWDPNPNTGATIYRSADTIIAEQTIHHGGQTASHVTLPVVHRSRLGADRLAD
ncbi:MAG TPA: CocE/NonD family hydrolase [Microbacteriaceae bacterium]|nr:CocE/NonD family hydrolase [Microbacteriaceae bacterium]